MGGAVTGTVQQMEYRLVPILHPLHAIGQRYFYFLFTTFGANNRCKASPGMIRREVQGSVFLYFGIGGAVTGTVQQMEYRLVPILHPLHAIGRTALSFLHTYLANNRCKASPGM